MINNKFFDLDSGFIRNDMSSPTEHGIRNLYFIEQPKAFGRLIQLKYNCNHTQCRLSLNQDALKRIIRILKKDFPLGKDIIDDSLNGNRDLQIYLQRVDGLLYLSFQDSIVGFDIEFVDFMKPNLILFLKEFIT